MWLDDISRDRLRTGNLQMLIDDFHVVGVTSNPTIFAKSLSSGDAYDEQIADLKIRGVAVDEASRMITTYDIRWACDVFRPVYDQTGGLDGRVSLEVDPRLAKDTEKTIAEARALWWMVDRPNLLIKIPATLEGLPAITQCHLRGDQRQRHADLRAGAVRRRSSTRTWRAWRRPRRPGVTCPDSARWHRSSSAGWTPRSTRGWTSWARPKPRRCAARRPSRTRGWPTSCSSSGVATDRWQALSAKGANVQRPLWASTSVKDPAVRRHHVRRRAGRGRHGEHHARGHDPGHGGSRQAARRHRARHLRRIAAGLRRPGQARHRVRRRGAVCSRPRACRSSRRRGTNSSTRSRRTWGSELR